MSSMIGSSGPTGYNYNFKTPKGYSPYSQQTMDPQALGFRNQLMGALQPGAMGGANFLSKLAGGDESMFQQMEAPAWNALESGMGMAGTRYSNMGMGAQNSSGFKQAMGGIAGQFGQQLASQRMSLQQQAIRDLFGMSSELMGMKTMESGLVKKPPSGWEQIMSLISGSGADIASTIGGYGLIKKIFG